MPEISDFGFRIWDLGRRANHVSKVCGANSGSLRRASMPAKRSSIRLMPGFVSVQLAIEGQSEASWLSEWMLANILERREAPFASLYCARNSYFSFAISTFEGHSALHPLHSRHRSSVSYSSFPVNSYAGNLPDKISRIKLARPRVECLSSMVAM